jgi:TonB-linked SusC/RagA family outer membrane protein
MPSPAGARRARREDTVDVRIGPSGRAWHRRWVEVSIIALILGLASIVAAQPAAPAKKGRAISGTIVDVANAPVAGATVTVTGTTTTATTAADGTFTLAGAPTTNTTLDVAAEGFEPRTVNVIGAKTALSLQLVLVRPPPPPPAETRIVTGVVTGPDKSPIANATVKLRGTETQVITASDGTFSLIGLPVTEVVLDIESVGNPASSVTVAADKSVVVAQVGPVAPVEPPPPTTRTIRGTVTEPGTGDPVVAAQVTIKETGAVAFTEADGTFVFENIPVGTYNIEVTATGHETQILIADQGNDQLAVSLALAEGEQIVIEGRAPVIVKQSLANGASVVKGDDLARVSAPTVEGALQGKLPGANLQFNSGAPGGGAQVRLRGISTINGQSSALYVIDGVIVSNVSISNGANAITGAAAGGNASIQDNPTNRIADLNPNDIETIEVLKGASAAALYGSKAANGVVLITTRRGRGGEAMVNVTQRIGISQVSNKLGSRRYDSVGDVQAQYCPPDDPDTAENENDCDNALVQAYNDSGGAHYDHESEVTRTPIAYETIASAGGGTEDGSYYGSILVHEEPGVLKGTFYDKQSGRLSLGYRFWDKLRVGLSANVIHSESDRGLTNNDNTGTSLYVVLSGTPEFVNLQPTNGVFPVNPAVGSGANPLQTAELYKNREEIWRLITGTNLIFDAYKSPEHTVSLLGNFGADSFTQKNNILSPPELFYEPTVDGLAGTSIDASSTNLNWNTGLGALWSYTPASGKFRLASSLGTTYESVDLNSVYVVAANLTAGQPSVDSATSVNLLQNRIRTKDSGIYLQEEVSLLDDRLSLLAGILGERSSLNGDTDKYYFFPKAAAVYSVPVPKETFDTLRVRGAYGEAGNRPNFGQKFTALNATNNIEGNPGLVLGVNAGDPDIKPERQREFELGADVALKDQRVVLELTGYQRSISDLLLQRTLAPSTGFTNEFFNGGSLRNRGIEAAVQASPLPTEMPVQWTTRATLTMNRSEITSLPDGVEAFNITVAGFGAGLGAYRIEEGKSATQIVTTDPNVEGGFRVLGDGEPDFRVGFSNTVTWNALTFSALLDWQQGSKIVNLTRLLYDFGGVSDDPEGAAARLDSFNNGDVSPYVEDATFLKVREISITYDLPKSIVDQLGAVKALQLQLSGRNLFTFTGYSGLDPEVSNFGNQPIGRNFDVAPYPPSRSFWLSVSASM